LGHKRRHVHGLSGKLWQCRHYTRQLHLQLGFYRPERRPVHVLCRRKIQNYDRHARVHLLRNWHVLDNSGRNDFRDLHRVSSCIRLDMSFMRCCD
jgi:hypothetical protein